MGALRNMRAPGPVMAIAGALLLIMSLAMVMICGGVAQAARAHRNAVRLRQRHHQPRRVVRRHPRPRLHLRHLHHALRAQMIPAVASWYYDAGNTACGFHARYGIANRTLPCGTKVRLSYDSHTVVATVDDRGPYVYGRSFDLDQSTAQALGMTGVVTLSTQII